MYKAYKYCLLPNTEQKQQLAKFFGSARFIYNLGLETKIAAWSSDKKTLTCIDLCSQMIELKHTEAKWLSDAPAQMLQSVLRNLDAAFAGFFRGNGFPKFKRKTNRQSIQFPQSVSIIGDKIYIPKLKMVEFVKHRALGEGKIKTVTVSMTPSGKYFVSILIQNEEQIPSKKQVKEESAVGIDVGLKTFAVLSDGSKYDGGKYLRHRLRRLRVEQRKLSRQFKKGVKTSQQSKNWHKQKLIVAKLHEKIANQRKDFLQKTSTAITKQYDTICLETLNMGGLQRNKRISLSVYDAGWQSFISMIEYKSLWGGNNIIYIGRFKPSSKTCSDCGDVFNELALLDREWVCKECGTRHDRDYNASKNIMNFGLRDKSVIAKVSQKAML